MEWKPVQIARTDRVEEDIQQLQATRELQESNVMEEIPATQKTPEGAEEPEIFQSQQTKETDIPAKEERKRFLPVGFIQIMIVITILIAAVLFRSFGGDAYERVRLTYVNLLSDPSNYRELFETDGAMYE